MTTKQLGLGAQKVIDSNPEEPIDWLREAISWCRSSTLIDISPTSLGIKVLAPIPGKAGTHVINFAEIYIPETENRPACTLDKRRHMAQATVLAMDEYLASARGPLQERHQIAATLAYDLARIWEWASVRGLYHPHDIQLSHLRELFETLGRGGWSQAVNIAQRTEDFLRKTRPALEDVFDVMNGRPRSLREAEVRRALKTNLTNRQLALAKAKLLKYFGKEPFGMQHEGYAKTTVRQVERAFISLSRIQPNLALLFDAKGASEAAELKDTKRTKNLEIETAVKVLEECFQWVYEKSVPIISLAEYGMHIGIETEGMNNNDRRRHYVDRIRQELLQRDVDAKIGLKVSLWRERGSTSLDVLIQMLFTAVFIVIAVMNGRRKKEVSDPTFGVSRHAIRAVNADLGIFEGSFYVAKTYQSYLPYFVNTATKDAHEVLGRINDVFLEAERRLGRHPEARAAGIFWQIPFDLTGGLGERKWYSFSSQRTSGAGRFFDQIEGVAFRDVEFSSHMFRRFYALVFMYRYEHGTLQALAYQFGHFNLEMTKIYVEDAAITSLQQRIPIEMRKGNDAAREAFLQEEGKLKIALEEVGREKLSDGVAAILDGENRSGNFSRLVKRLHANLMTRIDYSTLDRRGRTEAVTAGLIKHGHRLVPMAHGECMAGEGTGKRAAACFSRDSRTIQREHASAATCAKCPFHYVSEGYLGSQKRDLDMLRRDIRSLPPGSLKVAQMQSLAEKLEAAIAYHEHRLAVTAV